MVLERNVEFDKFNEVKNTFERFITFSHRALEVSKYLDFKLPN